MNIQFFYLDETVAPGSVNLNFQWNYSSAAMLNSLPENMNFRLFLFKFSLPHIKCLLTVYENEIYIMGVLHIINCYS